MHARSRPSAATSMQAGAKCNSRGSKSHKRALSQPQNATYISYTYICICIYIYIYVYKVRSSRVWACRFQIEIRE